MRPALNGFVRPLILALALLLATSESALAGEAAVVVRHGDGSITYALVAFSEEEISSFELLDRSTLSLTTVSFGGLGEAVCTLDGEGCPVSDCQQRLCQSGDPQSPFWQFFRPGADGAWVSQPLGASASRVTAGDVDVWSWTGRDANVPPLALTDVAAKLGVSLEDVDANAVVVASFDGSGKRIAPARDTNPGTAKIVVGVAGLALIAGAAFLLIRRRSAVLIGDR